MANSNGCVVPLTDSQHRCPYLAKAMAALPHFAHGNGRSYIYSIILGRDNLSSGQASMMDSILISSFISYAPRPVGDVWPIELCGHCLSVMIFVVSLAGHIMCRYM